MKRKDKKVEDQYEEEKTDKAEKKGSPADPILTYTRH